MPDSQKLLYKRIGTTTEVLERIPTKLLISIFILAIIFTASLIAYAVVFQNTPVEIWGIVKFGERADELRQRLVKLQADSDSRIAPDVYQAALARLKQAESKASLPSPESSKLRGQLKERDEQIAALTKQLSEARRSVELLTKDLSDAKSKVEVVTLELRGSQKDFGEMSRQLKEHKKKLEEMTSFDKRKALTAYIRQLEVLEGKSGNTLNPYIEQNYVREYNDILTAMKKELPNDNYIQNMTPLSIYGTVDSFSTNLIGASARARAYLEERYIK